VTARWVVDIAPKRELNITWEPISLLIKNQTAPDSPFYGRVKWTLELLRVMESIRKSEGDERVNDFYFEATTRIHHHKETMWDPAEALAAIGAKKLHAKAADSDRWDKVVRKRMDAGLKLVGSDVGTPIIAWETNGKTHAIFGPVITRVPATQRERLKLWDATRTLTEMDGFWELKRTRTESPAFGDPLR
jgi:hypothetical protein